MTDAAPRRTPGDRLIAPYLALAPLLVATHLSFLHEPPRAAISLLLAAAPAMLWFAWRPWPALEPEARRGGWLGLLAILALAALPRALELDEAPRLLSHDSAMLAHIGYELAEQPGYQPISRGAGHGTETAFFYLLHASLETFGVRPWALRLPGAVISWLSVALLFGLARELCGRRVAWVACLLAAATPWAIQQARTPVHSLMIPPVLCASFWALLVAMRRGGRWRYLLAGLLLGAGWHCYHGFRVNMVTNLAFPLAAAACWRGPAAPRGLREGWRALLGGYLVAAAPVLWVALSEPGLYLTPLTPHLGQPLDGATRLAAAWEVIAIALTLRPVDGIGLVSWQIGCSLAALPLLLRWRDRRGLVLAWLLITHLAPLLLSVHHRSSPRRYASLYPALFLLPAIAIVAVAGTLAGWQRRLWWGAIAVGIGLLLAYAGFRQREAGGSGEELTRYLEQAAVMRWVDGAPGRRALLPEGAHGYRWFHLRFALLDPAISELPADDPDAALALAAREVLIVVARRPALAERLRARLPQARPLELPCGGRQTLACYVVSPPPPPAPESARSLWVPRSGRWQLSCARGARGELRLGDARWQLDGRPWTVELALARGRHPWQLRPAADSPPWALSWRRLAPPAQAPAIARCLRAEAIAAAPPLVTWRRRLRRGVDSPAREGDHMLEDVVADDRAIWIAAGDTVRRYDAEGALEPGFVLRGRDGEPLLEPTLYRFSAPKRWSLALSGERLLVARRDTATVSWHDVGDGRWLADLDGDWRLPLDVAIGPAGQIAVADQALDGVVVVHRDGRRERRSAPRVVAVAWLGETLLGVDDRRGELLVWADGTDPPTRRSLGAADEATRLLTADGRLLVVRRGSLRLYNRALTLLAPGGDPAFADRDTRDGELRGAAWSAGRLLTIDTRGELTRWLLE